MKENIKLVLQCSLTKTNKVTLKLPNMTYLTICIECSECKIISVLTPSIRDPPGLGGSWEPADVRTPRAGG